MFITLISKVSQLKLEQIQFQISFPMILLWVINKNPGFFSGLTGSKEEALLSESAGPAGGSENTGMSRVLRGRHGGRVIICPLRLCSREPDPPWRLVLTPRSVKKKIIARNKSETKCKYYCINNTFNKGYIRFSLFLLAQTVNAKPPSLYFPKVIIFGHWTPWKRELDCSLFYQANSCIYKVCTKISPFCLSRAIMRI